MALWSTAVRCLRLNQADPRPSTRSIWPGCGPAYHFDVDYRPYSWPSPQVAEEVLSRAGALSDIIVGNDEEFGFMAGGIDKGLASSLFVKKHRENRNL